MNRDSELLASAISNAESSFTQMEKRIATYFLARPDAVLVETNAEIAKKLNLSPMTVTRFFRKLGFDGTADARNKAISSAYGPKTLRIDKRFDDNRTRQESADADADRDLCHVAVDAAFSLRQTDLWRDVVHLVARADGVHVTGFQTMHYLADGVCRRLSYLRDRVQLIDGIDGVYAGLLPSKEERDVLIIIDIFRYGAHGPNLAKLAKERGLDVVIFADEFCDWAADITPYVLLYPAETHFFLPLSQGITTGITLLLQDISAELGEQAGERVKELSKAQDYFGLFLD